MRSLTTVWCLGLTLSVAPALLALAADPPKSAIPAGKRLLSEGDALANQGKTTEAEIRYQEAMETLLPGIRRLNFKHPVKRDVTERKELRNVLIKEIEEEQTPEEARGEELALKAFGFIPKDMNYQETIVQVYTEEIGAFYDPRTKTMHLIKEDEGGRAPGLLERLLGKTSGFDKDQSKTVIAHELTHALADQHFGLDAMLKSVHKDGDRELALTALIEGEATLVMIGAQLEDWNGRETAELPADRLGRIFSFLMPLLRFSSGDALRKAPPVIAESMLFPYLRGLVFCAHLTNKGGWQELDKAYLAPPLSTEQILHPEKYQGSPDPPMAIEFGPLDPGADWNEVDRDTVGELQTSVLLRNHNGTSAAAGWDGDRYVVFEGPKGRLGLVWLTTWDSEDEAREFARSYIRFQTNKLSKDAINPENDVDSLRRTSDGSVFAVERRGADVAIVEGFPTEDLTAHLLAEAFRARKSEKTHANKPAENDADREFQGSKPFVIGSGIGIRP